jgi:branched-chain amino acid aminotransferase
MNTFYIDGVFVPESEAQLPVNDLAVLRGYGVFDFLRTYNGIPFQLEEHLVRLERSAQLIGLQIPVSRKELSRIVYETIDRNDHPEYNIRLIVTGGASVDNITPGSNPKLLVMVTAAKKMEPRWYTDGVKIITSHMDRLMPGSKSINYIPGILSLREAADRQAVEAVYVDNHGYLQEGTTSNFFAFFGDTLVTPPGDRILPGITRQVVIDLASSEFKIEIRDVHKDEIRLMDEAMITASNKEIMPVVGIDSVKLPGGRPGKNVMRIMEMFAEYTKTYRPSV